MKKKQESNERPKIFGKYAYWLLSDMDSQFTAAWACWHVDLNNAAVQWGWTVETRPKPSFQISLTWQVSTKVRGVEIQSLVQYWIKTVCCRSKDHFHWTALCTPLYPAGLKSGGHTTRLRRPCYPRWKTAWSYTVTGFDALPAYEGQRDRRTRRPRLSRYSIAERDKKHNLPNFVGGDNKIYFLLITYDKGGVKCVCPRLSVCLLARLLKDACMDLNDMLRVNRCRDMDELIKLLSPIRIIVRMPEPDCFLHYRISAAKQKFTSGGPIESRVWSIEWRQFQWPWTTLTPSFKVTPFLTLNISEMVRYADIDSMKY